LLKNLLLKIVFNLYIVYLNKLNISSDRSVYSKVVQYTQFNFSHLTILF